MSPGRASSLMCEGHPITSVDLRGHVTLIDVSLMVASTEMPNFRDVIMTASRKKHGRLLKNCRVTLLLPSHSSAEPSHEIKQVST